MAEHGASGSVAPAGGCGRLHLIANGLPWRAGDEVLVVAGDYPATVLPWLRLRDRGVTTTGWNQQLVGRLIAGINPGSYRLISPADGPSRSTLVVLEDADGNGREVHERLASEGIDIVYREGNLRLSLHLFNTEEQVDLTLSALHASAG
jgi:selenocysteine lyase/cysteine desulfurase